MGGKVLTGDRLISKHERLVTSLLRPCPNGEIHGDLRVNKAAGSCALACKHSGRTFAQLVKRLNLNAADVKRLEQVGVKGFFARHDVSDLYWPAAPRKAVLALASDDLYLKLENGTATPAQQRHGASWMKWMAQFVPDAAYEQRAAGDDNDDRG